MHRRAKLPDLIIRTDFGPSIGKTAWIPPNIVDNPAPTEQSKSVMVPKPFGEDDSREGETMQKLTITGVLMICIAACLSPTSAAAPPAPAGKGLAVEDTNSANVGAQESESENSENQASESDADLKSLKKQIADLQAEIQNLTAMLEKIGDSKKELEQLKGKVAIVEGDNSALLERVKTLEGDKSKLADRVKVLEGDNATLQERLAKMDSEGSEERTALKPAFVKSAVRFFNHEDRPVKMNVNGVWHTVKEGENTIWVPYAPVHVYRYTGAEPKTFWKWKEHMDGFVMDFDVGTP